MAPRSRVGKTLGDGRVWMRYWIMVGILGLGWGIATFIWLLDSVRNLNAISVITFWVSIMAGIQATLGMRKADTDDPL
jgi:hypothetical protein